MGIQSHLPTLGRRVAGYKADADFYPTCDVAIDALLAVEDFSGKPVWEPACGDGAIAKKFVSAGYDVMATDLHDRGYGDAGLDFLTAGGPWDGHIVTNPPFNIANAFVKHAVGISQGKTCMLLRLAWLESQTRKEFFQTSPLKTVHVFSKRLPRMHRGDWEGPRTTGTVAFAWFVWERGYTGKPQLNWL